MSKLLDTRFFTLDISDLRVAEGDGKQPMLQGYAAVFNKDSKPMKTQQGRTVIERILPGAFKDALKETPEVRATVLHDQSKILGRMSKGTVRLVEDDKGLRAEIDPPDTTLGRDTMEQVRRGDLDRMSFGFKDAEGELKRCDDGTYTRTIKRVIGMKEITLADDRAAYPDTEVALRMLDEEVDLQERATITMDDKSLVWGCRGAVDAFRRAFDYCNSIIDVCGCISGDLNDNDMRAIDDALGALVDMIAKARDAKAVLLSMGAEDEDDELDIGGETEVDPEDAPRMLAELQKRAELGERVAGEIRAIHEKLKNRRAVMAARRAVKLNKEAVGHIKQLIDAGKVDHGAWDQSKIDRDKGAATSFLGVDSTQDAKNEAHWKFPVVADGKVNRKALGSAAAYAKKSGYGAIAAAATRLGELADKKKAA